MSRPGPVIGPSGSPTSATGSGPLRVVAERLSVAEAAEVEAAEVAEAERRAADLRRADLRDGRRRAETDGPPTASVPRATAVTVDATAAAAAAVATATAVATVARLRAPGGPITATDVVSARESTGRAPVPFNLPPRRSGFAELFALITGRRRTGRHRPDCVRRQSWSMFSPARGARGTRRRGRFGSRV